MFKEKFQFLCNRLKGMEKITDTHLSNRKTLPVQTSGEQTTVSKHLLPVLLITILAFTLYANTLINGFVYDDEHTIVNNHFIQEPGNILKLFQNDYFRFSGEGTYRPVVTLSYFMDYAVFGLKAWGFHLTNVLLHTLNGVLAYFFLTAITHRQTLGNRIPDPLTALPFFISILFISHPVLTEAVNAISFREDLLSFLFYMSTLNLYLFLRHDAKSSPTIFLYIFSCLLYSFALLSKEMAVTLPLIIYCYEYIYFRENNAKISKINAYNIGYLLITAAYVYIRFSYFSNPNGIESSPWKFTERIFTVPVILVNYLKLLLFPASLSADYTMNPVEHIYSPSFIILFVLIFMSTVALIGMRKKEMLATFGGLFFMITLLPTLNIIPIANPFAERYLYLPGIGFSLIFGLTVYKLIFDPKRGKLIRYALMITVLSAYSITIINRNSIWINDHMLWFDAVKKMPDSARAHYNMGLAYERQGRHSEAAHGYTVAIEKKPEESRSHYSLGLVYHKQGQLDKAVAAYQTSLRLNPNETDARINLGTIYRDKGLFSDALREPRFALLSDPDDSTIHFNIGLAYQNQGLIAEAIDEYKLTLKLNKKELEAHTNLAAIYHEQGKLDEAIQEYRTALLLNPIDSVLNYNMGLAYHKKGLLDPAIQEYITALRLNPGLLEAHYYLGTAYLAKGMINKAVSEFETTVKLDPQHIFSSEAINLIENIQENKQ